MKLLQNNQDHLNKISNQKKIKPFNSITVLGLFAITFLLSSCEAIAGIFKAGMGFGIFIVIAIIGIIIFLVVRMGRSKKP